MSRAILVMALRRSMGREPTEAEKVAFLAELASAAGGERLYIPAMPQSVVDADEVWALRGEGLSVRAIARKLRCSKSTIGNVLRKPKLSKVSPYKLDTEAA